MKIKKNILLLILCVIVLNGCTTNNERLGQDPLCINGPQTYPDTASRYNNWFRSYRSIPGVWVEAANIARTRRDWEIVKVDCDKYLTQTNRSDWKCAGFLKHARLWVVRAEKEKDGSLLSVSTLWYDSLLKKVIAETTVE